MMPFQPSLTATMIVVNEAELIAQTLLSIYPMVRKIVVVEGATELYAQANPNDVDVNGHSQDGTLDILRQFPDPQKKLEVVTQCGAWLNKAAQRQACLDRVGTTHCLLVDADEMYMPEERDKIVATLEQHPEAPLYIIEHWHLWRPPALAENPKWFRVGTNGRWQSRHVRLWRMMPGMRYDPGRRMGHAAPVDGAGRVLDIRMGAYRGAAVDTKAHVHHYGYARGEDAVRRKTAFYVLRDQQTKKRNSHARDSAIRWLEWQPGEALPDNGELIEVPEPLPHTEFEWVRKCVPQPA